MKAFLLAAAFAILSTSSMAGAARSDNPLAAADRTTATVIADAGRLGSAGLTALRDNRWVPAEQRAEVNGPFDGLVADFDTGTLLLGVGLIAFLLSRPVSRALRRQEQQRRATALASTLHDRA